MNVDFVSGILPEVSKAHLRVIVITQIDKLDSDVLDPAFCRSIWEKKTKKVMTCRSKQYPFRVFKGLPDSPIRFDPDRLATFINKKLSKGANSSQENQTLQVCELYQKGVPMGQIGDKTGLHQQQVKREIQKGLKWFISHYTAEIQDEQGKKEYPPEIAPS